MRTLLLRNKQTNKQILLIFCSFHAVDSTCLKMKWSLLAVSLKYMRRSFEFCCALRFPSSHKALREKHISIICKGLSTLNWSKTNLSERWKGWFTLDILIKPTTVPDIHVDFIIYMVLSHSLPDFIATESQ